MAEPWSREAAVDARARARAQRTRQRWEGRARLDPDVELVAEPDDPTLRPVRRPDRVGSLVDDLAGRRGWGERLAGADLARRWEEVVGPTLATRCRPVRLAGGVLVVAVEAPAWATQLRFLTGELAARAQEVTGIEVLQVEVIVRA